MALMCLILLAAQNQPPPATTLSQAIQVAAADAATLPKDLRKATRYFWLGPRYPQPDQWADAWRRMNLSVNQKSREPDIVQVRVLPCGNVGAINLTDYGKPFTDAWDKLVEVEHYWHVNIVTQKTVTDTGAKGKKTQRVEEKNQAAFAPWAYEGTDSSALQFLVDATQSEVPIYRADAFVWQTDFAAREKGPAYFDFLGVKNEKDFDEAIGYNAEVLKKFPRFLRDAVAESTVAVNSRRVDAVGVIGGWYFFTSDVKEVTGKSNPLKTLGEDLIYDGRESLANLPNGLMAGGTFVGNRNNGKANQPQQGDLAKFVPPELASDSTKPFHSNDTRVVAIISCLRCHGVHGGKQLIDGFIRGSSVKPAGIQSLDPAAMKKLNRLYLRPMEFALDEARRAYHQACGEATGWDVPTATNELAWAFEQYDKPLDLYEFCLELGVDKEVFLEKIRAAAQPNRPPTVSTVLGNFVGPQTQEEYDAMKRDGIQVGPVFVRPKRLPRIVVHEHFSEAMNILRGR